MLKARSKYVLKHVLVSDGSTDMIQVEGLLRFSQEIHLDVYSIYALVFNWRLGAVEQGQWTRDEFCNGLVALGYVSTNHTSAITSCDQLSTN